MPNNISILRTTSESDNNGTTGQLTFWNSLKCWMMLMFQMRLKYKASYIIIFICTGFTFTNFTNTFIDQSKITEIKPTLDTNITYEEFFLSDNFSYVAPDTPEVHEFVKQVFPDNESSVIYVSDFYSRIKCSRKPGGVYCRRTGNCRFVQLQVDLDVREKCRKVGGVVS